MNDDLSISEALDLIKQGLASVQTNWEGREKLVDAVRLVEKTLKGQE